MKKEKVELEIHSNIFHEMNRQFNNKIKEKPHVEVLYDLSTFSIDGKRVELDFCKEVQKYVWILFWYEVDREVNKKLRSKDYEV